MQTENIRPRVLVVDDDDSILDYLHLALNTMGYEPTAVSTATQAIGFLKTGGAFPLVLTDVSMPGISGIELLRIVKKNFPDTQVIMLTGNISGDLAIQALNEGAFAYLTKPVNPDELRAALRNAWQNWRLTQENRELSERLTVCGSGLSLNIVVALDPDGNVKRINRAVESLTGMKEDEVRGRPLARLLGALRGEESWRGLAAQTRAKEFPLVFGTVDGREAGVLFTGTVMKDREGRVVGIIGTGKVQE